jgi:transposase
MEITQAQFAQIEHCLPLQRGNVSLSNLSVLNAILYVAEHGCKWRGLPKRFGNWHTIYTRMNRWSKSGVLDRVFEELQQAQVVRIRIEAVSLDSTIVKVHPDGTGALKKNGPQSIGKSRGGWTTKIHMVAADARTAVTFSLSPGQAHDGPEGRALLSRLGAPDRPLHLLMDRAYEGNETRQLALDLGFIPVVPPLKTRVEPWEYDREMYKRRNEVERLFRRLKGYRRIFSRFEKLDVMFVGFISFALIADGLRLC